MGRTGREWQLALRRAGVLCSAAAFLLGLAAWVPSAGVAGVVEPGAVAIEITALAAPEAASASGSRLLRIRPDALYRVYAAAGFGPIWLTAEGPRPAVAAALAELRAAEQRGLVPDDFDIDALERQVAAATSPGRSPAGIARADVALTTTMLQLLSDLRHGRVRPQDVEPHYRPPGKEFPFAAPLADAVAQNRLGALIDGAEPPFPLYARLKSLLPRYRVLAAQPWPPLPALPPRVDKIEPGARYAGTAALHERLHRLGDLPDGAPPPADDRYAGALVDAVEEFQRRHGLAPDGVLGRRTLAELNVPPGQRARQIELSLERLRWLPDLPQGPMLVVNIPSFRLWVFSDWPVSDRPALAMPVIVGRAVRTETPVFVGEMRYVEFSPYWNVPPSILRNELLPALARDRGYLDRNDMELVSTRGDGRVTTAVDDAALAALGAGDLRMRQRPGAKNALGGVKFVLPNTMDIYLHGTPARALFERTRRDFSHGCIRVADPQALAGFVLRDQPEWTDARIEAAMAAGTTTTVRLKTTLPVIVFYTTAIADAEGRGVFLADVYGHDRKLERALSAARARPR
jgi:murein L,D-transpeptidase YcbB/YkuD